jgi:hypothetical protein
MYFSKDYATKSTSVCINLPYNHIVMQDYTLVEFQRLSNKNNEDAPPVF